MIALTNTDICYTEKSNEFHQKCIESASNIKLNLKWNIKWNMIVFPCKIHSNNLFISNFVKSFILVYANLINH